ncbi:MAG: glycoside hydrolase family 2 TIM barrel-domain containing protein [Clostridia bacterium]|nr:glycoside hydrolase family 2 TIM barrel-domain containing protein [Clostridia bacterium]
MMTMELDHGWEFRRGFADLPGSLGENRQIVDLPHDGMIGLPVRADAPAGYDSGYFPGDMCNYTKYYTFPENWKNMRVGLKFDGVMMHATVDVNGSRAGEHHYGYSPFYTDITDLIDIGRENRITVNVNAGVQSSSRWYSGCGLFRGVKLCVSPQVHIADDGVFIRTKEITADTAFMEARIEICNETPENRLAKTHIRVTGGKEHRTVCETEQTVWVGAGKTETARLRFAVKEPELWSADEPNLYAAAVTVTDTGVYRTRFEKGERKVFDSCVKQFGIRTVSADALRGLLINGRPVKLKGGCVHHDNGLLGAVSLYEVEARKVRKLKELGFNAIRTAHNPPSEALVEACDREGMYIFDEAFDAWRMAKRPGDFSTYFNERWEQELTAFVRRDRIHPSVIIWSTGNEIPERGGLSGGYPLASRLAEAIRMLDGTRPVSNGICSFWCGLDDELTRGKDATLPAPDHDEETTWDRLTEPFANGLDIVGYNYLEDLYEKSHERFPDRVILGSENYPKEIGFRWPLVERLPYVIGDFTWTAWDYIGEAGIGKSLFVDADDPLVQQGQWAIMPPTTSPYPWRLANDADIDIIGNIRPQGAYRSVVWGSEKTHLYAQHPVHYGKTEVISPWGFTDVLKSWNFKGYEGQPIRLTVFTNADEAALIINGREAERKPVCKERPLPCSVCFDTVYAPGTVETVSYKNGNEVSRDRLETTGEPAALRLVPEKDYIAAECHDAVYIGIEVTDSEGRIVPDAVLRLEAGIEGPGRIAGFGTADPVTEEDYTDDETVTFGGRAAAIIRGINAGQPGKVVFTVRADRADLSAECILPAL